MKYKPAQLTHPRCPQCDNYIVARTVDICGECFVKQLMEEQPDVNSLPEYSEGQFINRVQPGTYANESV